MPVPPITEVLAARGAPRVVTLVAHGLNNHAHVLRELHEPLRDRGATVVLLRMRGHTRDGASDEETLAEWKSVDQTKWLDDWRAATAQAQEIAERSGVPLTFLGYSLGALVHVLGLASGRPPVNPFKRQVLLAPALRTRRRTRLVLAFRAFGPGFVVPSFAPPELRAHAGTSVAAYEALFACEAAVAALPDPAPLHRPTLVLIDPRDELVSERGVQEWITRHHLAPDWQVFPLGKGRDATVRHIRHHIVNERGMGHSAFVQMVELVGDAVVDGVMPAPPAPPAR